MKLIGLSGVHHHADVAILLRHEERADAGLPTTPAVDQAPHGHPGQEVHKPRAVGLRPRVEQRVPVRLDDLLIRGDGLGHVSGRDVAEPDRHGRGPEDVEPLGVVVPSGRALACTAVQVFALEELLKGSSAIHVRGL
eukprot:9468899-Pyramimonas_sp.AAC.1